MHDPEGFVGVLSVSDDNTYYRFSEVSIESRLSCAPAGGSFEKPRFRRAPSLYIRLKR